ncbi:MAG: flagellar filament capping protein FliD [Planctomycetaceae bacterium]|nr:flagellar filament capping protein FliD [Planctomycetaceae bacterium]
MASNISIGGLASGLDSNAIIDALVSVERIPIQQLQAQKKANQDKINLFNTFRGKVDALRNKANTLGTLSGLMSFKVSASVEGLATVTASGSATPGTHTLLVEQVSATDRWAFDGVTDPAADLATADSQSISFTYDGQSYSVAVRQGASSLNELAAGINAEADGKVAASVVNSGTSSSPNWQLVLTAEDTGQAFRIQNLTTTVAGLSINGTGPNGAGVAQSPNNISVGRNAVAIVDGLRVERTDNDFDDVIAGVSISLLDSDVNTTMQFTVESDKSAIKGRIKEFIDAYNDVIKFVRDQNKYDEEKGAGGPLFGENALRSIQRSLSGVLFGQSAAQISADTAGYGTLRLVGVESQADGSLKINDKVMDAKMDADLARFADLFADTDGFDNQGALVGDPDYYTDASADTGLGDDLAREIDKIVKSYGNQGGQFFKGIFDSRLETLNSNNKQIDDRISEREDRVERMQAQLKARYAALESMMAKLQSQSSYLNSK